MTTVETRPQLYESQQELLMPTTQETFVVNMAAIGGGGGLSTLGGGLRELHQEGDTFGERWIEQPVELRMSAVTTVADDGGNTAKLLKEGVPAVGDTRRNISAFMPNRTAADLQEARFGFNSETGKEPTTDDVRIRGYQLFAELEAGGQAIDWAKAEKYIEGAAAVAGRQDTIDGGNFGNYALVAGALMDENEGKLSKASAEYGDLVGALGTVIPVSDTPHRMVLHYTPERGADEITIVGEDNIDHFAKKYGITNLAGVRLGFTTDPNATNNDPRESDIEPTQAAIEIVKMSDGIVTGHGSAVTSVLPGLEILGRAGHFKEAIGKLIVAANLSDDREAKGATVNDVAAKVSSATGIPVDAAAFNTNTRSLAAMGQRPMSFNKKALVRDLADGKRGILGGNYVEGMAKYDANDKHRAKRSAVKTAGKEVGKRALQYLRSVA